MGSSGGGTTQTNPEIRGDIPLQNELIQLSRNQLLAYQPYSGHGAGYRFAPNQTFGQVAMPGPNPTNFGNAYATPNQQYFGPSVGGGAGGGSGGGGAQSPVYNSGAASKMGGYTPPQQSQLPGYGGYQGLAPLFAMLGGGQQAPGQAPAAPQTTSSQEPTRQTPASLDNGGPS